MATCFLPSKRFALPQNAKLQSSTTLLSCALVCMIPAVLAVYWPLFSVSEGPAVAFLRPPIFLTSLLLAMMWYRARITAAELHLACILGLLIAALLVPSLASTDPKRALGDWVKLLILCSIALLLSRALRHQPTAKCFGVALIIAGLVVGAFTVVTYVRFIGFVIPTYKLTREFKGIAERADVPLNAIPFTAVFSFLAGMCLVRVNGLLCLLGCTLFVASSVFTGSRAPFAVLLASALVLALLNALGGRKLPIRIAAYVTAFAVQIGMAVLILETPFKRMSSITEGRWDLWYVAWTKFAERPLLGFGYSAWHDDLASMLPGAYSFTGYAAKNILGGYHNEYLGLLADQGIVGFVPAMLLVCFLFYCCYKCAFRSWNTWPGGQWPLFTCIFLLLRAGVEIPGLFGEGSEPADFLAYIFVAIVISRFSIEEDFLRATTSSAWSGVGELRVECGQRTEGSPGRSRWSQGRNVPLGVNRSHL